MSVRFCQPCLAILRKIGFGSPEEICPHHENFADLCDAANDGCHFCQRLRLRFIAGGINDSEALLHQVIHSAILDVRDRDRLLIAFRVHASDEISKAIRIYLELVAVAPDEECGMKGNVAVNTGSDESLSLAAQWLETCITCHTTCNRPRPLELDDWKPSRLLYLGNENGHELRLCQGRGIPNQVKYATLSHCWGTDPERQTLTKRNIASWENSIPEAEMMQTFKDAIKVTRRLKIQYLWIDSLCIIQDSNTDWLRESSLMSNVYKYSLCNIAASAADDDHGGLFCDRDPFFDLPTRVNLDNIGIHSPDVSPVSDRSEERGQNSRDGLYDLCHWQENVNRAPLSNRAWVLQERILSPRTLHFSKAQLYWECNEVAACEAYPNGIPIDARYKNQRAPNPFNLLQELSERREEGAAPDKSFLVDLRERSFKLWTEIVGDYTRANLTKESDKVIAISAIAREVQPLMQSRYFAGLWESDLIHQLGWSGGYGHGKSSVYCAPSWSWASTTSHVYLEDYHLFQYCFPLIEIVNLHIDLDGDDEFGPVRAGYLDILGQLFPCKPQTDNHPRYFVELDEEGYGIDRKFSTDMLEGQLYCMPLILYCKTSLRELVLRSLILQQCDLPNVYRRLGTVIDHTLFYPTTGNAFPELLGKFEWPKNSDPVFTRNTNGITSIRLI